ncbi:hypothetical protein ACH427_19090 [Streptomyces sp. NPDC020379]|uniref:hypothetical protein n=1 Tax=Streptomyces sp. NPDC020379 TaxID=3365071 RepID=UPI00378B0F57
MIRPDPTSAQNNTEPQGEDACPWDDPAAARAEIERLAAELASHAARVAELEPAAAELHQLQEAGKTEAQRLTERAETAERQAEQTRAELVRAQVAHSHGLTERQAARLVGTTREELEADADELLADIAPAAGHRLMQPDPTQGSSGRHTAADPAAMFAGLLQNSLHR